VNTQQTKEGWIDRSADFICSTATIPGGAPVLRQIAPVGPVPSRGNAFAIFEFIGACTYEPLLANHAIEYCPQYLYFLVYHPSLK
jgi:hypothetical protein